MYESEYMKDLKMTHAHLFKNTQFIQGLPRSLVHLHDCNITTARAVVLIRPPSVIHHTGDNYHYNTSQRHHIHNKPINPTSSGASSSIFNDRNINTQSVYNNMNIYNVDTHTIISSLNIQLVLNAAVKQVSHVNVRSPMKFENISMPTSNQTINTNTTTTTLNATNASNRPTSMTSTTDNTDTTISRPKIPTIQPSYPPSPETSYPSEEGYIDITSHSRSSNSFFIDTESDFMPSFLSDKNIQIPTPTHTTTTSTTTTTATPSTSYTTKTTSNNINSIPEQILSCKPSLPPFTITEIVKDPNITFLHQPMGYYSTTSSSNCYVQGNTCDTGIIYSYFV